MKKLNIFLLLIIISINISSQKLEVIESSSIKIEQLPEYIVVTSENTKFLGELETLLQNRKKLRIRNQTDLLNAMSKLGFAYVDAYNASAGTLGIGGGDDVEIFGSQAKYRINMVFRKKMKYRD